MDGSDATIQLKLDNNVRLSLMPAEFNLLQYFAAQLQPLMASDTEATASQVVSALEDAATAAEVSAPSSSRTPLAEEVLRARVAELEAQLAAAQAELSSLRASSSS